MSHAPRPPHLHWGLIALVAAGGTLGAASREAITLTIPRLGEVPIAMVIINLVGAFLLGLLYEAITRRSTNALVARRLRLLFGTGFCGGFTSYSALAVDTTVLLHENHIVSAVAYSVGTLVVGAFATWAGIACAHFLKSRMPEATAAEGATHPGGTL